MSDTSGGPLTDWAAARVGANKRTLTAARSSMASRSTRSDVRRRGPLHLDVKRHLVRSSGGRPAPWPTRGHLARCCRSTAPQPAPSTSEPTLWPSTCVRRLAAPDRVRVNRHGSGDPEFPGPWRPIPTILPGAALGPTVASFAARTRPVPIQRIAISRPDSSILAATGPRLDSSPPSCSSRSIDPLKPYPACLDSRLRQTGSVPVLQIPGQSVRQSSDLWSYDTEHAPSDPCGHS